MIILLKDVTNVILAVIKLMKVLYIISNLIMIMFKPNNWILI